MNLAAWKQRQQNNAPAPTAALLSKTLGANKHLSAKLERYSFVLLWREVVGDEIASISRPERIIAGNTLVVQVIDSVWAQELSLQKEAILSRLRVKDSGAIIEDLRFSCGNPRMFARNFKK